MDRGPARPSLFSELKRRHVYRVGAFYVAASFVVWQVADIVVPAFELPLAVLRVVVLAAVVGFPIALVLAWVYELTPGGIRRTAELDAEAAAAGEPASAAQNGVAWRGSMRRRLATASLVVLIVLSGAWWAAGERLFPRAVDPAEMTLAVFPFSVRGGAAVEYLREGVVDLLSRNLSGAADLTTLDPALVLRAAGTTDRMDVAVAAGIARRFGAGQFVLGSVSQAGAQVRIDATLYALRDSIVAMPPRTVQGDTARIFELIDQLTAGLLAERSTGAASQRLVRTAAVTTASLPALKAYLQGEQHFRHGVHDEGIASFRRAVELDSSFALARYRLALSHHMRGEHDIARRESRAALRHVDRLGSHDRRVIEAFHTLHAGRVTEAERMLRTLVAENPRDLEARLILAELITRYAPLRAQPAAEARQHLEVILEADPQFACIYCQIATANIIDGDYDSAESWLRRAAALRSGDSTRLTATERLVIGLVRGDPALVRSGISVIDTVEAGSLDAYAQHLSFYLLSFGDLTGFEQILAGSARRSGDPARTDLLRYAGAIARGRFAEGEALANRLLAGGPATPGDALTWHMLIHAPFEATIADPAPLRSHLMAALDRVRAQGAGDDDDDAEAYRIRLAEAFLALGLLASRAGDPPAARAWADSISLTAAAAGYTRAALENHARLLRADLRLRSGDAAGALRELESATSDVPPVLLERFGYWGGYPALIRAHAHGLLGQHDHALRWFRFGPSFYATAPFPLRYATWNRDIAWALEGVGRGDEARVHFARFASAWADAEPDLRLQVEAARERLGER